MWWSFCRIWATNGEFHRIDEHVAPDIADVFFDHNIVVIGDAGQIDGGVVLPLIQHSRRFLIQQDCLQLFVGAGGDDIVLL